MLQYQIEVTVGKSLLRATGNGEWPVTRARRGAELQPGSEVTASLVAYSHNCPDTELRAGELGAMQTCRPCLTLFGVSTDPTLAYDPWTLIVMNPAGSSKIL